MRGAGLFDAITVDTTPVVAVQPNKRKGRNSERITQRNECLIYRLYYYRNFTVLSTEKIREYLCDEFWLEPVTLPQVLGRCLAEIKEVRQSAPTLLQLRNKYPHLVWLDKRA